MEENRAVTQLDANTWKLDDNGSACYLLVGGERALLIDSGLGNLDLGRLVAERTDKPCVIVNTHYHGDHIGGNGYFPEIYIGRADQQNYVRDARGEGPVPIKRSVPLETIAIDAGYVFDLGGRTVRVYETPGHSAGSICLLDVERRWLFTGDCCCRGEVLAFAPGLPVYRDTMARVLALGSEYDVTWPAHGETPVKKDVLQRILMLAEDILAGKVAERPFEDKYFKGYVCAQREELGIVYPPLARN